MPISDTLTIVAIALVASLVITVLGATALLLLRRAPLSIQLDPRDDGCLPL
jgi:hypothetical protein